MKDTRYDGDAGSKLGRFGSDGGRESCSLNKEREKEEAKKRVRDVVDLAAVEDRR